MGDIMGRTPKFKLNVGMEFKDEKRNIVIIDREFRKNNKGWSEKWYKYKCNNCGWDEGWIQQYNLLKGTGCSCCCNSPKHVVRGINDIATTDPWMIKYFVNHEDIYKYTSQSNEKVEMKCSDCGNIKTMKICDLYIHKKVTCNCSDGISYPEKFILNLINQLKIDYIYQLNKNYLKWCDKYKYDIYIPSINIIIEIHGMQHYKNAGGHWQISFDEQHEIDMIKRNLAIKNKVHDYIELDCRYSNKEYIKESILNSNLVNYFNFDMVDWNKADEFATSNFIRESCNYYMKHKNKLLFKEMADNLGIHRKTLRIYLKKGRKLGWCDYDENNNKKRIKCIETNEIFNSVSECVRKFENEHNIILQHSNVASVCRKERDHTKGFHFEYIDKVDR